MPAAIVRGLPVTGMYNRFQKMNRLLRRRHIRAFPLAQPCNSLIYNGTLSGRSSSVDVTDRIPDVRQVCFIIT